MWTIGVVFLAAICFSALIGIIGFCLGMWAALAQMDI